MVEWRSSAQTELSVPDSFEEGCRVSGNRLLPGVAWAYFKNLFIYARFAIPHILDSYRLFVHGNKHVKYPPITLACDVVSPLSPTVVPIVLA